MKAITINGKSTNEMKSDFQEKLTIACFQYLNSQETKDFLKTKKIINKDLGGIYYKYSTHD